MATVEYLQAMLRRAREYLPAALYQDLHRAALPSAGGNAAWRSPQVTPLEKLGLDSLTPDGLQQANDEVLNDAWKQLATWHKQAGRRKQDQAPFARFASHLLQELQRRDMEPQPCALTEAAVAKSSLADRLADLPDLAVICEGFVAMSEGSEPGVASLAVCEPPSNAHLVGITTTAMNRAGMPVNGAGHPMDKSEPTVNPLDGAVHLYDLALVRSSAQPPEPVVAFWDVVENADPDWDATEQELGDVTKSLCPVFCAEPEKQIIWYMVSEPGTVDAHGHQITREEIEDACHGYMVQLGVRYDHGKDISGEAKVVENFTLPAGIAKGGTFHGKVLDAPLIEGSWMAAIHYHDNALWKKVKAMGGGISWGGMATKVNR